MKTKKTMRWIMTLLLLFIAIVPTNAQYGNRNDKHYQERYSRANTHGDVVELILKEAGTLEEKMPANMANRVRLLHIEGPIDYKDLKFLKKLCNRSRCYDNRNNSIDNYIDLELEHARIMNNESSRGERDVLGNDLSYADHLRLLLLPERLKRIDADAFTGCSNLEEVIMPRGVRAIGRSAFNGCSKLEYISLPEGLETIGKECFKGCKKLDNITIPHSVMEIGERAFSGTALKRVVLPAELVKLGAKAFENTPIASLVIPAATQIVNNDLGTMKKLVEITVEKGSQYYSSTDAVLYDRSGHHLLYCPSARTGELIVPDHVSEIANYAFAHSALTKVTLPPTVNKIGASTFAHSAITSFKLPEGVTKIAENTFYDCSKLASVELHPAVTAIGESAFENCTSLRAISLPNAITVIKPKCFKKCSSLASVSLPSSLTDIGKEAFEKCSSLLSIDLPRSLNTISERAFKECSGLTKITVPDACTDVKKEAFVRCSGLNKINLGNGLLTLGDNALRETAITTLVIPASVTHVGKKVAEKCKSLTRIECHAVNPPKLDKVSDKNIKLFVPASSLSAYLSAKNWKNFKTIRPLE